MRGTITKYTPKTGKPTFGYCFVAGRAENGRRIQIWKRGFAKKADAEEALKKAIEEQKETKVERVMPTFGEFFARWDAECFSRECAPKTAERYRELGRYAIKLFGQVPLDQLCAEQLATALNQLSDRGGRPTKAYPQGRPLAPKTIRHIAFLLQGCLDQAVGWDLILKNPMEKVKKPKVPRRRPKVVDRAGFACLLQQAKTRRLFPLIVLAAATGMRRGELLALEWTDLDWDKGTLEVSKSLEETDAGLRIKGTKSGETRRFSVPAEVLDVVREHQRVQQEDRTLYGSDYANLGLIFARPDGFHYVPSNLGKRVSKLMRKAGLTGLSLHSLRHSHASELLSQGAPITAVAERLGHASPNITLGIYSHALPADNQAAAKLWNDAMAAVIQESRKEVADSGNLAKSSSGKSKIKVIPIKSAS